MSRSTHGPYKGLIPYDEEDADYFFGRENVRQLITSNLRGSKITIVYGESGVGKSSVLRAGVLRDLRRTASEEYRTWQELPEEFRLVVPPGFLIVYFRDWSGDPVADLAKEVQRAYREFFGDDDDSSDGDLLAAISQVQDRGAETYLVLDQFEEFFLYHNPDRRGSAGARFADALAALLRRPRPDDPEFRCNVLVSLRKDALAMLDAFRTRIPQFSNTRLEVPHLDRESAADAIRKPLEKWVENHPDEPVVTMSPELEEAILNDLLGDREGGEQVNDAGAGATLKVGSYTASGPAVAKGAGEVQAAMMQLVMTQLWQEREREGPAAFSAKRFRELGGAEGIAEGFVTEAFSSFDRADQLCLAKCLRYLVTGTGKIALTVKDLATYTGEAPDHIERLLTRLTGGGLWLLRPVQTDPEVPVKYELAHDLLAGPAADWRDGVLKLIERRRFRRKVAVGLAIFVVAGGTLAGTYSYVETQKRVERDRQKELEIQNARANEQHALEIAALRESQRKFQEEQVAIRDQAEDQKIFLAAYIREFGGERPGNIDPEEIERLAVRVLGAKDPSDPRVGLVLQGFEQLVTGGETAGPFDPETNVPGMALALRGHSETVHGVAMLTEGEVLSWSADQTIRKWDLANPLRPATAKATDAKGGVTACAWWTAAAGVHAVCGDALGNLSWLRFEGNNAELEYASGDSSGHSGAINDLGTGMDERNRRVVISASDDGLAIVWARVENIGNQAQPQQTRRGLEGTWQSFWRLKHGGPVTSVHWKEEFVLTVSGGSAALYYQEKPINSVGKDLAGRVIQAQFSLAQPIFFALADNGRLGSGIMRGGGRIEGDEVERRFNPKPPHDAPVTAFSISPDGSWLVTGDQQGGLQLDDGFAASGGGLQALTVPGVSAVRSFAWSADSRILAAGTEGGVVFAVRVGGARPDTVAFEDLDGPVESLSFSPSGKLLAADSGRDIHVYRLEEE